LPVEAKWPGAEFIIGNPPFLGTKKLRASLGDEYVEKMFAVYGDRIPNFSDLCCYWFEKAWAAIEAKRSRRAGLLATQGIRGGENNRVLQRIKASGDIFFGVSDQEWILNGAAVHVSMIGFDDGAESERVLDDTSVSAITPELRSGVSLVSAVCLSTNQNIGFIGDVKGGPFDVDGDTARAWLNSTNPDGRANAEVVRPWMNSLDVTRRPQDMWIVDFGGSMPITEAAVYERPFAYVAEHVKSARETGRPTRKEWWLHMRPCPSMRAAVQGRRRFLATPTVAKHRLFVWLDGVALPDHQLVVFGREDDYFLGVLQSSIHERWARRRGTQLRDAESGFRYTPTTCFETFPFPAGAGGLGAAAYSDHERARERVAVAAARLIALRDGWLNPKQPDGTPALSGTELNRRTLTNLYNERPAWLEQAHLALDRAVLAAYGWPEEWAEGLEPVREKKGGVNPALGVRDPAVEQEILTRLLELNRRSATPGPRTGGRHTAA
jgi:type II restriction/modification system DNA methylase subunit YeeA